MDDFKAAMAFVSLGMLAVAAVHILAGVAVDLVGIKCADRECPDCYPHPWVAAVRYLRSG